jgi:hypothetical protein
MPKLSKRKAILDYNNSIAYIPLGRYISSGFAIVDIQDSWLDDYWWRTDSSGYAVSSTGLRRGQGNLYMHRLLLLPKEGFTVDHVNRKVTDNRRSNLRYATKKQQMQNRSAHCFNGRTSRYKGVCLVKRRATKKDGTTVEYLSWQYSLYSALCPGGRAGGQAKTEKDAALKYNDLAIKYHGDRAVLNVVS